jgi:hypothetical protein
VQLEALLRRVAAGLGLQQQPDELPLGEATAQLLLQRHAAREEEVQRAVVEAAAALGAEAAAEPAGAATGPTAAAAAAVSSSGRSGPAAGSATSAPPAGSPAARQAAAQGSSGRQQRCRPKPGLVCAACGGRDVQRFKVCAGCGVARYCNKNCQRAHWPEHRRECAGLGAAREQPQA